MSRSSTMILRWGTLIYSLGLLAFYLWSGYSIGWRNFSSKRDSFYIFRLETLVASPFLLVLWWLMWRIIRRPLLTTTTLLLFLLSTYGFFQIGCITRWTREAELAADYVERCLHETDGELESLQELLRSEQAPNLLHGYDDDPPVSILITGGTATHAHEVFVMSDRYYWSPHPDYSRSRGRKVRPCRQSLRRSSFTTTWSLNSSLLDLDDNSSLCVGRGRMKIGSVKPPARM